MAITAAQIREARALLRWTSPKLARNAGVGFDKVLKAQDDEAIRSLSGFDVRALQSAFEAAGVVFAQDGTVQIRKART